MPRRPRRFADPKRFALGIGIPSTMEHWEIRTDGHLRDLASMMAREDARRDIETMGRQADLAARSGVHVVSDLSASALPDLFADKDVVTVAAHTAKDGSIEIFDTSIDRQTFVDDIPAGFDGCLELLYCFSEPLADRIRFSKGCLVLGHAEPVGLRNASSMYLMALLTVIERGLPYPEALFYNLDRLSRRRIQ